jgi:hypothetical protein
MDQLLLFIFGGFLFCLFFIILLPKKYSYICNLVKSSTWPCVSSLLSLARKRFNAWLFLIRGPTMIQEAYEKVNTCFGANHFCYDLYL